MAIHHSNIFLYPYHAHLPSDEPPAPPPVPGKKSVNDPSRPDSLPPIKEPDNPVPKAGMRGSVFALHRT